MKKLFFVMAAVAALFTSCSKDDTIGGPIRGKVTFEVSTPELATRYGEGATATTLQYAVYDMIEDTINGKLVDTGSATLSNKTVNVSIDLVEGRKYTAIFWADAGKDSPYDFNEETKTVSYKDINALEANQEAYDAFFAFVPQNEINVGETVTVELKRPFAQLRIETSDTERAKQLDVEVVKTGITVNAYTSFNLVTGDVDGEQNITFTPTVKASARTTVTNPDNTTTTYDLISMNYLLVNNSEMVDVTLNFTDDVNGTEQNYVRKYTAISVQRNYRTLVRGTILTDPTNFNVTVKQDFDGDLNANVNDENNKAVGVSNVDELQKALDAATNDTTIYFTDDITGDVTATQKPDVKITILGNNHDYKGAITVDGKSARYVTAGLTIQDVNFKSDNSITADANINLGKEGDTDTRYTANVTVKDCKFSTTATNDVAAIKSYTGGDHDLSVIGCEVDNTMHSLLQLTNVEQNLIIKDCVAKSKNGINLGQTPDVDIDNYTADVKGYAVRFGANSGGKGDAETYSIKNSSLKSANDDGDAVIILRVTADNSTLIIENTTIEGNPTITNNATNAKVNIVVSTADQLADAIKNNANYDKIALANDITVDKWIMFSETKDTANGKVIKVSMNGLTIDGQDHLLTINSIESAGNGNLLFDGASKLDISNLTIKQNCNKGGISLKSGNINKVNFIGDGYGIHPGEGEIKVEECTFATKATAIYYEKERDNLTVNNCTFNQPDDVNVILLRGGSEFTNNTVNFGRTVNIVSGSPVVTGNNFNNVRLKVYSAATATISNNTINNLMFEEGATTYSSTFSDDNTLSAEAQAVLNSMTKN